MYLLSDYLIFIHPVLGCRSLAHTMLDVVFQLPVQERHQITCRAQALHRVIQEDLIGSVHQEKVPYLKDHLHIHHPRLLPVLHTVEAGRQR